MFLDFLFNKKKNNKIALVLGGGGTRGFFHIGVLKALRELNIEISEIIGSSSGALVGLVYCANPDIDFQKILKDFHSIGIIKMLGFALQNNDNFLDDLDDILKQYVPHNDFKKLKIKFSFTAFNINSYKIVKFSSGKIFPNIRATFSIPGLLSPFIYKNMSLCDSASIVGSPVSFMKPNEKFLVSNCSSFLNPKSKNLINSLDGIIGMNSRYNLHKDLNCFKSSNFILLDNNQYASFFDFDKKHINKYVDFGYSSVMKNKNKILRLVNK